MVYLATRSFMLIYANEQNVRLYYSDTLVDSIAKVLSEVGLIFVAGVLV